jgi:hypothetical protein
MVYILIFLFDFIHIDDFDGHDIGGLEDAPAEEDGCEGAFAQHPFRPILEHVQLNHSVII